MNRPPSREISHVAWSKIPMSRLKDPNRFWRSHTRRVKTTTQITSIVTSAHHSGATASSRTSAPLTKRRARTGMATDATGSSSVRGSWGTASGSGPAGASATTAMLAQPLRRPGLDPHIGLSGERAERANVRGLGAAATHAVPDGVLPVWRPQRDAAIPRAARSRRRAPVLQLHELRPRPASAHLAVPRVRAPVPVADARRRRPARSLRRCRRSPLRRRARQPLPHLPARPGRARPALCAAPPRRRCVLRVLRRRGPPGRLPRRGSRALGVGGGPGPPPRSPHAPPDGPRAGRRARGRGPPEGGPRPLAGAGEPRRQHARGGPPAGLTSRVRTARAASTLAPMSLFNRVLKFGEGKKLKALQSLVPDINAREPE